MTPEQIGSGLERALRSALAFAASRSAITAEQEKALLACLVREDVRHEISPTTDDLVNAVPSGRTSQGADGRQAPKDKDTVFRDILVTHTKMAAQAADLDVSSLDVYSYIDDEMAASFKAAVLAHLPDLLAHPEVTPKPETAEPVADEHELIERLLDAQQDINYAANCRMDQSLCNAAALIDEIEPILRRALADPHQTEVVKALECPNSPDGKHQVDTSIEEGPCNCFHCGVSMKGPHQ